MKMVRYYWKVQKKLVGMRRMRQAQIRLMTVRVTGRRLNFQIPSHRSRQRAKMSPNLKQLRSWQRRIASHSQV
jgi:hypothetical protein